MCRMEPCWFSHVIITNLKHIWLTFTLLSNIKNITFKLSFKREISFLTIFQQKTWIPNSCDNIKIFETLLGNLESKLVLYGNGTSFIEWAKLISLPKPNVERSLRFSRWYENVYFEFAYSLKLHSGHICSVSYYIINDTWLGILCSIYRIKI